ncbi:RNA polymerase sigma factor [Halostella salina]|uniref:hypothetical protein n=1 Tax=Halostella salina TaxID=1547897 RepID=UPI000EF76FA3|nr:hypothetical protein [Halostella salina]
MPSNRPVDRRTFLKTTATTVGGVATLAAASTTGRAGGDSGRPPADDVKERIRDADPDAIREAYAEAYGKRVAGKVVARWRRYARKVLRDRMDAEAAFEAFLDDISSLSGDLRRDIADARRAVRSNDLRTDHGEAVAAGELDRDSAAVTDVTTQDSQEVLLIDGGVGGDGVTGFRDSNYYTNLNKVTAICETLGAGFISQWAWLEGNVYIQNGGTHDLVCDYFENGLVVGGSASYDVWIQEEGDDYKTWGNLKSTSSSVYGEDSRAAQFTLSDDSVYNVGVRLKVETSGIGEALSDYQTINADGSTRGLEINELRLEPV